METLDVVSVPVPWRGGFWFTASSCQLVTAVRLWSGIVLHTQFEETIVEVPVSYQLSLVGLGVP